MPISQNEINNKNIYLQNGEKYCRTYDFLNP